MGTSSFSAPGAARAIKELGLAGKFFATGGTIPSEVRDYLKEGVLIAGALWNPALSAKAMLNLAVKMYNGETIGDTADLGVEGYTDVKINGTLVIGEGMISITKDNVDDFTF